MRGNHERIVFPERACICLAPMKFKIVELLRCECFFQLPNIVVAVAHLANTLIDEEVVKEGGAANPVLS